MKNKFFALFDAEPEALGGGATPSSTAAPAAEAAAAPEKPGFLQTVLANVQSKTALLTELESFKTRATAAESQVITLTAELATANQELATLRSEREQIQTALEATKAEVKDVDFKAAQKVASLGFDVESLPAPSAALPDTVESITAQLEKETDNNKRWELAQKLAALN